MALRNLVGRIPNGSKNVCGLINLNITRGAKKNPPGCDKKFDPNKMPCQGPSRKLEAKKLECYAISKKKPVCGKKKQTSFKPKRSPKTMWDTDPPFDECMEEFPKFPEICCPKCPFDLRLDYDHYYPKGLDRDFIQTWIDCPSQFRPVEVCRSDQYEMKYDYRPKQCRPKNLYLAQDCRSSDECMRFDMAPCCVKARIPPKCLKSPTHGPCKKMCCPVPAYSECCLPDPYDMPTRSVQCRCLDLPGMCDVFREMAKMKKRG